VFVGPLGPPRGVECEGEDLTASDLADGEIPAGQALPWGVCLTGGVPVDLGPACLPVPAWVHCTGCTQRIRFSFKRKVISRKL
jgi:hypothetical protein